jgi:hypothetical protein
MTSSKTSSTYKTEFEGQSIHIQNFTNSVIGIVKPSTHFLEKFKIQISRNFAILRLDFIKKIMRCCQIREPFTVGFLEFPMYRRKRWNFVQKSGISLLGKLPPFPLKIGRVFLLVKKWKLEDSDCTFKWKVASRQTKISSLKFFS